MGLSDSGQLSNAVQRAHSLLIFKINNLSNYNLARELLLTCKLSRSNCSRLPLPVSDGYFGAFHIPLIAGREFNRSDSLNSLPVAVVSRKFVTQYFPGEDPIGHRIHVGGRDSKQPWLTVVGVAEDACYSSWDQTIQPAVYMSAAQIPPSETTYAVVTNGKPEALAPAARKTLALLDSTLPLDLAMSYRQYLNESLTGLIYASVMLAFDALVALLLAAIGIFGVMANQVGERTREIGVRLAMGANRKDVLGMILRRATWLTATGVGTGLALAFVLAHLVANLLRGVGPDDPIVFGSITAIISGIALLASWIPARRAARIDPIEALRDQ
jgi:putative ABC transport system permease protein